VAPTWRQASTSASAGVMWATISVASVLAEELRYVFAVIHVLDAKAQPGDETGTASTREACTARGLRCGGEFGAATPRGTEPIAPLRRVPRDLRRSWRGVPRRRSTSSTLELTHAMTRVLAVPSSTGGRLVVSRRGPPSRARLFGQPPARITPAQAGLPSLRAMNPADPSPRRIRSTQRISIRDEAITRVARGGSCDHSPRRQCDRQGADSL
jgi:hypothetical protein